MKTISENALGAKYFLSGVTSAQKDKALTAISHAIRENCGYIIQENAKDIENAQSAGMPGGLVDRLMLNENRVLAMADSVLDIVSLPDPCGRILSENTHKSGIVIKKISVPLGVIGIIYESRPNVTVDAAALCFKSGNAVILRGGKEAIYSNTALADIMRRALKDSGFDENCIQLIKDTSRQSAVELMTLNSCLDCLIPRGGKSLIKSVIENSTVPVIETGSGNCHIYVDEFAQIKMAAEIIFNAKTQRIGVCNACESLVIHSSVIGKALPAIKALLDEKSVEIRGDERAQAACSGIIAAAEDDWGREYLDYIISVKTVDSVEEAIKHINKYSTHHSEAIITENAENAKLFLEKVDSAAVYLNASTRFTDGGEFGMGAEIGISTQKLHARGPMGLEELTTSKYVVTGSGQIRK
ncbi:MAG: glutamate-5-semialdehyde dehydrogenase [Clostridiales bacterium]|nr:glutamate-5-semialdehyde dehydrogenase [Clostridiales bacterium]